MVMLLGVCAGAERPGVLLISIDGMRPDYVTKADEHGSKIPNLRELLREGVHANVHGVLPTATYPSHTTILTGVSPGKHGIYSNHPFDPALKNPDSWYWYSQDIKVPTLWEAAAEGGYVVGSVSWPVSVGALGVRYDIPEYADTRSAADLKMVMALAGRPLMEELAVKAGPYITDVDDTIPRDWARTRYAVELIRQKHVRFMTVHLASTDHLQHRSGPFHKSVLAALEEVDKMVGELRDAMRAEDPGAYVCVVSDHGFAKIDHYLRLDQAFVNAGLIKLDTGRETVAASGVADWTAMPWAAGGSAAIVLKEPGDGEAQGKVKALLDKLAADPANGIASIMEKGEIEKMGGTGRASYWVDMKPGYAIVGTLAGAVSGAARVTGNHGYVPTHAEMDATFILDGPGVEGGRDLGGIDMRSIAPTLARVMGITFGSAELPALDIVGKAP
jgi:predicted AlkP superfamily pyrophosphatase or phosphodiesterase